MLLVETGIEHCCLCSWKSPLKVVGIAALLAFIFAIYELLAWAFYVRTITLLQI